MYRVEAGQSGLAQSSKALIMPGTAVAGNSACAVSVHSTASQAGLSLYIATDGVDIQNCNIRRLNTNGSQDWLDYTVGNPSIPGGATQFIEYEIIARDAGGGTVDVDARIDGVLYSDVLTGYTQAEGFPGQVLYRTNAQISNLEVTSSGATDPKVIFQDLSQQGGANTLLRVGDIPWDGTIDWSVFVGNNLSALETEGTDTVVGGAVILVLPGSSLVTNDPVTVVVKDNTGTLLGAYFMVVT